VGGARVLARSQGAGSPVYHLASCSRACGHSFPDVRARASRPLSSSIPRDEAQLVAAGLVHECDRQFLCREGKVASIDEMAPPMNVDRKERGCYPLVTSVEDVAVAEVVARGLTERVEYGSAGRGIRGLVAEVDSASPRAWGPNVAEGLLAALVDIQSFGKVLGWCRGPKCEDRDHGERLSGHVGRVGGRTPLNCLALSWPDAQAAHLVSGGWSTTCWRSELARARFCSVRPSLVPYDYYGGAG
jgi:hypothetical protein